MAFALALVVRAQEPQPKLAGRVTQADTGSPLEGATITLIPPFVGQLHLQTARTDRDGNYRFERMADGTYSVTASADGFVPQDYERDASPEGAFVRVDSTTSIHAIDFQLAPEAVIRGTVVDVTGKPVADLPVTAVRQDWKITPLHGAVFARTATNVEAGCLRMRRKVHQRSGDQVTVHEPGNCLRCPDS
jgi:Carboxypeptidase regulatory-like domain